MHLHRAPQPPSLLSLKAAKIKQSLIRTREAGPLPGPQTQVGRRVPFASWASPSLQPPLISDS